MIADIISQRIGDAGLAAGGRTHPQDIVVPPLDVERMMMHEIIHDLVGMRPAIVNIADNVQVVYGQPFDQIRQGINKLPRAACF